MRAASHFESSVVAAPRASRARRASSARSAMTASARPSRSDRTTSPFTSSRSTSSMRRQIRRDHGPTAREILHEHARQPLARGSKQADIRKRDQLLGMRMKAGEDDVALDPERPDTRFDVVSEPAVPREDESDFREAGHDPRKALQAFQMPLARLEDGKHHDDRRAVGHQARGAGDRASLRARSHCGTGTGRSPTERRSGARASRRLL